MFCLASAKQLPVAQGDAGASAASLPVAPQGDDPCPGPCQAGSGSSLCDSASCLVTAPQPGLGYGCAVSSGVSTALLQPNSLLQNPFSSPMPYQVWFFPRNECIEDGWAGWNQLAVSHRLGLGHWKEAEHGTDRQQPNRNELLLPAAL